MNAKFGGNANIGSALLNELADVQYILFGKASVPIVIANSSRGRQGASALLPGIPLVISLCPKPQMTRIAAGRVVTRMANFHIMPVDSRISQLKSYDMSADQTPFWFAEPKLAVAATIACVDPLPTIIWTTYANL